MATTTGTISELGPNMQKQDMVIQAKARVEYAMAIESKYPTSAPPPDELAQVKQLLEEAELLEGRVAQIEEKEGRSNQMQDMLDRFTKPRRPQMGKGQGEQERELTPGEQFTRSLEYQGRMQSGGFTSQLNSHNFAVQMKDGTSLIEWKTLLAGSTTAGGPWIPNDLQAGATQILQRELNILDMIPRLQTSSDTIEYVLETAYTNAAAFTAEATGNALTGTDGRKPESTLTFSTNTSPVRTLAHWLPVTNRMLADAPAIRGYINSRLLLGLTLALEAQVMSGDGTGENLTGILNTVGVQSLARGANNQTDALFIARTMVRTGGKLRPTGIVMNPVDFQAVRLLRENAATATLGQYLMGPPNVLGPTTIWGLPVVESENIAVGTVLVGAFDQGATVFDREQSAIRVGTVNDQFVRNIQTILAEQRLALVVYRPTAFTKVTGY